MIGSSKFIEREIPPTSMTVRLATDASVTVIKRVVGTTYTLKEVQYDDDFIILDSEDKFDVILGLPWLRRYEPQVSWHRPSVDLPAACSPDGHLMNVLELPRPRGCTKRDCDVLTCGSVVRTTAHDRNVINHHTVDQVPDDGITTQESTKVHHSNKSNGPGHGCPFSGQNPDNNNNCQYGNEIAKRLELRE